MLSGLLRCSCCGGNIACVGGQVRRYGCTIRKNRCASICSVRTSVPVQALEAAVLKGTRRQLLQCMPEILRMFETELRAYVADLPSRRRELEAKLRDTQTRISRLVSAIESGAATASTGARLRELETAAADLRLELARTEDRLPAMPSPRLITARIEALGGLGGAAQ